MPYIRISTNKPISAKQALELKAGLGRAVEQIPGKSESVLMVEFVGEQMMFYRGETGDFAFIDVRFSGSVDFDDKKRFTENVFLLTERVLGIKQGNANLTITNFSDWGTKGTLLGR